MSDVEAAVSGVVRDSFSFACIAVPDKDERLALERRLIALLSITPLAQPSPGWLGRHSYHPAVRHSGLWNTQHVDAEPLTVLELTRLQHLVTPPSG
jgi:hypothetical protein